MRIREIFWAVFWLALAGLMVIYSKSNAADQRHAVVPSAVSTPTGNLIAAYGTPFLIAALEERLAPDHLTQRSLAALRAAYAKAHQQIIREELASNETRFRIDTPGNLPNTPTPLVLADREMAFLIVHDDRPDCAPRCGQWLAGVGRITENSYDRLQAALDATAAHPLPLILDSRGGQINAAISMGALLRERNVAVSVGKTMVGTCDASKTDCAIVPPSGKMLSGYLVAEGARCVSACPFVFMGGTKRVIESPAILGIHRVTMLRQQGREEVAQGFGGVQAMKALASRDGLPKPVRVRILHYLAAMGIDQEIFDLMMRTPPERMDILSPLELDVYGITTGTGNARTLSVTKGV